MKKLIAFLILTTSLFACTSSYEQHDTVVMYCVDSVEYHGIGQDNTLQTTPYWKLYLNDTSKRITVTSFRSYKVGDSVKVIERKLIKIENHGK